MKDELTFYTDDSWKKVWRNWERYLEIYDLFIFRGVYEITGLVHTQEWLIHGGGLAGIKAFRFLAEHGALGQLEELIVW